MTPDIPDRAPIERALYAAAGILVFGVLLSLLLKRFGAPVRLSWPSAVMVRLLTGAVVYWSAASH